MPNPDPTGFPRPVPVPGIVQEQNRSWVQLVSEICQLHEQKDRCELAIGDRFVETERIFGRRHLKIAAEQAGIEWSYAKQRHWVSRKIPPDSPLRELPLTFSHYRVLAGVEDMDYWAEQAINNDWSAERLKKELDQQQVTRAQEEGHPCIQCEQALPEQGEVVSFRVGNRGKGFCCSPECAANYFQELATELAETPQVTEELPDPLEVFG